MDYRKLLKKYIRHVGSYEGVSYLADYKRNDSGGIFTDEEWEELCKLEIENHTLQKSYDEKFNKIEQDCKNEFISFSDAITYVEVLKTEFNQLTDQ